MIYGSVYKEGHSNNSMFSEFDITHKHNPLDADIYLRELLQGNGFEINTPDLNIGKKVQFQLHFEVFHEEYDQTNEKKYLIALECPTINQKNRDRELLKKFDRVFSWDKAALSWHPGFEQIFFPNKLKIVNGDFVDFNQRDGFVCLINANKSFKKKTNGDLYVERYNWIKWMEKHHPSMFDLYGIGWNKPYSGSGFLSKAKRNMLSFSAKHFGHVPFPSYRGEVASKDDIYKRYKFAICYENVLGYEYYITEKIIDALTAGCVPVYWGASKVTEYIPSMCFVDRRDFRSNYDLFCYLKRMTESEYSAYQSSIKKFVHCEAKRFFSFEKTFGVVADRIVGDFSI